MKRAVLTQKVVAYVVLIVACALALFPLLWIGLASFKQEVDADAPATQAFHFTPTLVNYISLFQSQTFLADALTTVVTTIGTTLLSVIVGTLAAYAFSRLWVLGRRLLVTMMVLVQVVPQIVLLIPLYQLVSAIGLYDRWITLIVVQTGLFTPFVTWLMLAFFRSVPVEIEEAAFVDGVNRYQLFRHILIPMLTPGVVAASIFTGISAWNSFLVPVVLGQSQAETLTAFTSGFITQDRLLWAQMCAAAVLIVGPVVVFTLVMQKPLVRGITAGSVK
ncbi:carbohydrate ABC transporter permease [Microbacterium sp. X-17]|uniref:carbohydrate ABC transporter permease n=1 Tax=Microbacterium sp. X-17 TaxID=3144404 RepID=UPI0031F4D505